MRPNTKHNLKWALSILFIRAPLLMPVVFIAWLNDRLDPFADWLCAVIPGFKR